MEQVGSPPSHGDIAGGKVGLGLLVDNDGVEAIHLVLTGGTSWGEAVQY